MSACVQNRDQENDAGWQGACTDETFADGKETAKKDILKTYFKETFSGG